MHVKTKDYEYHEKDKYTLYIFFLIQNNFYHKNNLLVLQIITKYYDITCLEIDLLFADRYSAIKKLL